MTAGHRNRETRPVFTVFTPTFNRAHTLHRVYESLCAQTFRDFEWLVVDDGSTDETAALVARWTDEGRLDIRYVWQSNQGKHAAHNRAVADARGDLFLPFDSDDACIPNTLERFWYWWQTIPEAIRPAYYGVGVLTQDARGRVIGDKYPGSPWDADTREIFYRYKLRGEKWGCGRIDILRECPFPATPPGTNFIPEGLVWFAIARRFKMRYVNEPLRIYHEDVPSLTRMTRPSRSAAGKWLAYQSFLNGDMEYFWRAPMRLGACASQYVRFGWHAAMSPARQLRGLCDRRARWLYLPALPVGTCLFWLDRLRERGKD